MPAPKRPVLRYHGGKWKLAPWIISHFPEHRVYVEPFGGGASVLLRKPRAYAEVYNDLDGEIVNLFRVLRDPEESKRLRAMVELTPFARDEFSGSFDPTGDTVERARRLLIRAAMGFGNSGATGSSPSSTGFRPNTGFRSNSNRANTTPAHDWRNYPANIPAVVDRLRGVVIENRDAVAVMAQHDSPETLHYCDPPYVHSTRSKGNPHCNKHNYRHEMTDADHQRFAEEVRALSGMVVVSGYRSELYDGLFGRWARVDVGTHADGARDRVESLWLSPTVSARMQPALMEVA